MTIITLTTDFGDSDGYVGALKGVILGLAPGVTLVDISHNVPPQDVRHGARVLATAAPFFPPGTLHLAVVDPGVGSARRGIALQTPTATFIGPDNGLFTPFMRERTACVALTNPATHLQPVSATFHGRDVFAPVAARLAGGLPLHELGPPVDQPLALPTPQPTRLPDGRLQAEIIGVDHFGNLLTNVPLLPGAWRGVRVIVIVGEGVGEITLAARRTYSDVAPGELLALVGSEGYLEIALREGSAAARLGLSQGAPIEVWGA
jgi:hypothetical protein